MITDRFNVFLQLVNYLQVQYSYVSKSTLGRDEFLNHFGTYTWDTMTENERKTHQFHNCSECLKTPHRNIYVSLTRYNKLKYEADMHIPSPVKTALGDITNEIGRASCRERV